jgi:hypothetical protein
MLERIIDHRAAPTVLAARDALRRAVVGDLSTSALPVLPVLDQIFDHRGIGQGRGVAQAARFVLGDLAQDAAHDLAGITSTANLHRLRDVGLFDKTIYRINNAR